MPGLFAFMGVPSTQGPFPFPRVVSTPRPFTFTRICRPGFRLPRGAIAPQRHYGCYESCLTRVARLPFSNDIERAPMPSRFTRRPFNSYDGKTDPVEHVNHYIHMRSLHTHNDALMCKVFPSSLRPTALRWFNGLQKGSIHSFAEMIQ